VIIKIGIAANCNGIHLKCINAIDNWLEQGTLDLVILIETKKHQDAMGSLKHLIAASPATTRPNTRSLGGGICILGSSRLKQAFLKVTEATTATSDFALQKQLQDLSHLRTTNHYEPCSISVNAGDC
jgi:hypothetical protein